MLPNHRHNFQSTSFQKVNSKKVKPARTPSYHFTLLAMKLLILHLAILTHLAIAATNPEKPGALL